MSQVKAFKIRKPWYIILEHAKLTPKITVKSNQSSIVTQIAIDTEDLSDEEKKFNGPHNIKFDAHFSINEKDPGPISLSIEDYWIKYVIDNSLDYKETFNKHFTDKKTGTKPKFRHEVDRPILSWNKKNKIKKTFGNRSKEKFQEKVTDNICQVICNIAELILKDKIKESPESKKQAIIDELKIIKYIRDNLKDEDKNEEDYKRIIKNHTEFWISSSETIPSMLHDSIWVCYERTDGVTKKKGSWGIAQNIISIDPSPNELNSYTTIKMNSKYDKTPYFFEGIITYESQSQYLVAQLKRNSDRKVLPSTPSFFVLSVSDPDHQNLLIGYHLYYSIYYRKFLTKTVIWEKKESQDISAIDLACDEQEFKNIPLYIRQFLYSRAKNRLTIPSTTISNLDQGDLGRSLQAWLSNRVRKIKSAYLLHACVGKYDVCYFYGDIYKVGYEENSNFSDVSFSGISIDEYIAGHIRVCELKIGYDENQVDFIAEFSYFETPYEEIIKESKLRKIVFIGKVRHSATTVEIVLENEETLEDEEKLKESKSSEKEAENMHRMHERKSINTKTVEGNYLLLNFSLPNTKEAMAKNIINNQDYFEGIISGISDKNNMPASFRTLVVKKSDNSNSKEAKTIPNISFKNKNYLSSIEKKIVHYFRQNRHQTQITILPKTDNTIDKYPTITLFRSKGGRIVLERINPPDTMKAVSCFNKAGKVLNRFFGENEDEAFKKANQWLSVAIAPIEESHITYHFPHIQQLRDAGGKADVNYINDPVQNKISCEIVCFDKDGNQLSDVFTGPNEWEAMRKADLWSETYFS